MKDSDLFQGLELPKGKPKRKIYFGNLKYWKEAEEGRVARPGTICPYLCSELGKRAAWLAAHYDTHGKSAWEKSRR